MSPKILCAGTSSETFAFVKRVCEPRECQVIKATSVALAIFLAQKNFPSVILSEFTLSDGTALDLLDALKQDSDLKSIPFILFSGNNELEQLPEGLNIIEQPVSEPVLAFKLNPYLVERIDSRESETTE